MGSGHLRMGPIGIIEAGLVPAGDLLGGIVNVRAMFAVTGYSGNREGAAVSLPGTVGYDLDLGLPIRRDFELGPRNGTRVQDAGHSLGIPAASQPERHAIGAGLKVGTDVVRDIQVAF